METNKYCSLKDLHNESDVEQKLIMELLKDMEFKNNQIRTKANIDELTIGKGRKKEVYRPDYMIMVKKTPKLIIDAKNPINDTDISKFEYQLRSYSMEINCKYDDDPLQYYIISNASMTSLYKWNRDEPLITLRFDDFNDRNHNFIRFRKFVEDIKKDKQIDVELNLKFLSVDELNKLFNKCHNIIHTKDKLSQTKAFYEFSKVMFIKMKEDRRITDRIISGEKLKKDDLIFSEDWIKRNEGTEDNPFKNVLFRQIRDDLENEIIEKRKKRIFSKNDELDIKPNTIKAVVRLLQDYDLHTIDEDLNGRMFESFLNATVKGKELGQFFTPRQVVKYMVNVAGIKVDRESNSQILDGCCGSGGFLIEAMAVMIDKVNQRKDLTDVEKEEVIERIQNHSLFGVEANTEVASIARMNMYLHGDGGSNIYSTDFLDPEVTIEKGDNAELVRDTNELKELLVNKQKKFDLILTNPPFSMKYKDGEENEGRILKLLGMKGVGKSIKSNILFLIRYHDLLSEKGELITVIDDSLLNAYSDRKYLEQIKERYIIKQIISLPFNTFKNADTSIKTSILYLRKKVNKDEKQPAIFMAICNNIGHNDNGKTTLERNNLPFVLSEYRSYVKSGRINTKIAKSQNEYENLTCPLQTFIVKPNKLANRLDAFYYSPELEQLKRKVDKMLHSKMMLLDKSKFNIIETITKKQKKNLANKKFKYVEVGSVNVDGGIQFLQENKLSNLPSRAGKMVKTGDVIIAKSISCIGNNTIIPEYLDGQFVSTGFIVLRPQSINDDYYDSFVLWIYLRQKYVKKQFYYKSATAVQPEVNEYIFSNMIDIPIPKDIDEINIAIDLARKEIKLQESSTINQLDSYINVY